MSHLLNKLERRFGRYAVPRLTMLLVVGQAFCFAAELIKPGFLAQMTLDPAKIMQGEVWRLTTFLFIPPNLHPVWIFFALYIFSLMGGTLEHEWGEFRYSLYYLIGYLATLAIGFFITKGATNNTYLMMSVFLAFAHLHPNFELYVFFILPVKVKWLALFTWIGYGFTFLSDGWHGKALVLAAGLNYFAFFGVDIVRRTKTAQRRMKHESQALKDRSSPEPFHRCAACGLTDQDDRHMDFRVCLDCTDGKEYCQAHLRDHAHS